MLFGKATGVTARLFHSADISELMEEFRGNRKDSAAVPATPQRSRERRRPSRQRAVPSRAQDATPEPVRAGR